VKAYSSFVELEWISWPWSFAIDSMHLFWLKVGKTLLNHWSGGFFPWEINRAEGKSRRDRFQNTDEPYCIKRKDCDDISKDMAAMKLPTVFGDSMGGVFEFRSANEWKTCVKIVSPIVLRGRLLDKYY
jgi:hypothetical protein